MRKPVGYRQYLVRVMWPPPNDGGGRLGFYVAVNSNKLVRRWRPKKFLTPLLGPLSVGRGPRSEIRLHSVRSWLLSRETSGSHTTPAMCILDVQQESQIR
jgi:hypothetical protein